MKKSFINSARKGFTLVEILVVVSIIGLLAAIIIPSVGKARQKAQVTSVVAEAKKLQGAIQSSDDVSSWPITDGTFTAAEVTASATGTLNTTTAVNYPRAIRLDQMLVSLGKADRLFETPLSPNNTPTGDAAWAVNDARWNVALRRFSSASAAASTIDWSNSPRVECRLSDPAATPGVPSATGINFRLDGIANLASVTRVQYIVIPSVVSDIAFQIASLINGAGQMDSTVSGVAQVRGAVSYAAPTAGLTDVYIYLFSQ